jgi:hypothetical protein
LDPDKGEVFLYKLGNVSNPRKADLVFVLFVGIAEQLLDDSAGNLG